MKTLVSILSTKKKNKKKRSRKRGEGGEGKGRKGEEGRNVEEKGGDREEEETIVTSEFKLDLTENDFKLF